MHPTHLRRLIAWSVIVALGGFLFGFDTAVISGGEQAIQAQWGLSDALVGQTVAMALYGTVIGALFGGWPADLFGRKRSLIWVGALFLISAVGSALAPEVYTLMAARFIGGLGVGASSVVAPMYISEVAPKAMRGRLVVIFQLNIVAGIMAAYISNYFVASQGGQSLFGGFDIWRVMLGVEILPALVYVLLITRVPRSPRWLVLKAKQDAEALSVLEQVFPPAEAAAELALIRSSDLPAAPTQGLSEFLSGRYKWPILLAFLFAFFNQTSGINAIIYYAPRIFASTGLGADAALLASAGVGTFNLVFTVVGMLLIDRLGRRTLMLIGSVGLILALGLTARAFVTEEFAAVPYLIFAYISFFAMSQGAVIWVFISEIFPNEVRAFGNSFGCGTHWVFAAIIASAFPPVAAAVGGEWLFAFFTVMMVGQLLYVAFVMPETKGKSLEELQRELLR